MRSTVLVHPKSLVIAIVILSCASLFLAQAPDKTRVPGKIQDSVRSRVQGNLHPLARPEFDTGKVGNSFPMERVTLMFKSSAVQEAALQTLLREQQDPSSPNYQQWLQPEEFAERFGLSNEDINKVTDWLHSQGFTIDETAQSRRWISFTGTAAQIESAFHTSVHGYEVNNEFYYANATEPTVPAALRNVVLGFRNLNSFRFEPRAKMREVTPDFTSSISGNHFLAPDDFATIYNIKPLYAAGIDGTGQKIAVAGQTNIQVADIRAFRAASGLPASDPQVVLVPGSRNPGISSTDLPEANLDLQWAGGVARNASIIYVNSRNVFDSFQYAIDQNLAPVLSVSYGDCEANWNKADRDTMMSITQQANAQGITIVAASGDSGAADCDRTDASTAALGLGVDIPAVLPTVTGIGGNQFNELGKSWNAVDQLFGTLLRKPQPAYWFGTNNEGNGSAISYIPEMGWNDTFVVGTLTAGGGGRSIYFQKPDWQIAPGVPADSVRDVPDISFNASPVVDGYLYCTSGSCVTGYRAANGNLKIVGGTSVGAPAFAGVLALLNQKLGHPLGNVNPTLYRLAVTTPAAFHDITVGGNAVPCDAGSKDCVNGFLGYPATPGYDLATGLGSIDVFKLLTAWQ